MAKRKRKKKRKEDKYQFLVNLKPESDEERIPSYTDDKGVEHFIVKVQVSISGSSGTLVYNEDHSVTKTFERSMGEGILGDDLKGYFWAHLEGTIIHIDDRAPDQPW